MKIETDLNIKPWKIKLSGYSRYLGKRYLKMTVLKPFKNLGIKRIQQHLVYPWTNNKAVIKP